MYLASPALTHLLLIAPVVQRRRSARRVLVPDFVRDPASELADMNGRARSSGSSDSSSSSRGRKGRRKDHYFRIGRSDRFLWARKLLPKLHGMYTDPDGADPINGPADLKRKANILQYVEGLRAREAQEMFDNPGEDRVPYISDTDGQVKLKPWRDCTTRECVELRDRLTL